jgi:GNAT superfamily N-acetyltransferase
MQIAALTDATARLWEALFVACGSACFCHYWQFVGTKNEWLARCFGDPDSNRRDQRVLVRDGAPEAHGLLAIEEDAAIGWIKLAPRSALPKLLRQGAYRRLDLGPAEGMWGIACLLVHPSFRRRGVARALVMAAVDHVRERGGKAIEAYPREADYPLHDEEAWLGTPSLFAACGFARIAGEAPYPVMRQTLAG